jgi:hypothetical protein
MGQSIKWILAISFCTCALLFAALWNGYPLLYSDTAAYVFSGFNLQSPNDRPIMYGLFLRLFSLNGRSIWLIVIAQAAILSYLLQELFFTLYSKRLPWFVLPIVVAALSVTTGVSWTSSLMLADVFTPIALLAAILFLLREELTAHSIFLLVIFILSCSTHASHILLFNILFVCIFLLILIKKGLVSKKESIIRLLILLVSCNLTYLTARNAMNKSGYVFFAGAMVENGIMKEVLDEECENKFYKLCRYKDSLPDHGYLFLWEENSPLYKIDGWNKGRDELCELRDISFSNTNYFMLHVEASAKATSRQLGLFKIADGTGQFTESSNVFKEVTCWFKFSKDSYLQSEQYHGNINGMLNTNSYLDLAMYLYIILYVLAMIVYWKKLSLNLQLTLLICALAVILNAFVSGTFANSIDRLGCKMMWLIPLSFFMILLEVYQQKKSIQVNDRSQF